MNGYLPQRGFTLLEVLVALVIITLATTAAYQAMSSSAKTQQRLEDSTFSRWVAENEMASIQLGLTPPAVGETRGSSPMAGRLWNWRRQISVAADPALRRVKIIVSAEHSTGPEASLVAFVLAEDRDE